MSDWKAQVQAFDSAYEHFFPELSDYRESPTKIDRNSSSPFQSFLLRCGVPELDPDIFVSSGANQLSTQRRYSDKSKKHVKTLDELEYAFSELVARVASLRSRSIDQNGSRDTFLRVQGEIAQIAGDVDKFQFDKVDAVIPADANSGQEVIRGRRKSLNRRCNLLREEIEVSDNLIHQLLTSTDEELLGIASETESTIDGPIPALDELQPDWSDMIALQKKAAMSAVCRRFCTTVEQAQVPLCDAVFEYLISPAGHAFSLEICHYEFSPGELKNILTFMTSRHKLRTELISLVLCDCGLDDTDCILLSEYLPDFSSLQTLCIRRNFITSDGLAEIVGAMAENEMKMKCLQFDRNEVDAVGMVEVGLMLPKCPLLSSVSFSYNPIGDIGMYFFLRGVMNSKRRAFDSLPLPPDPEGLIGRIMAAYNITLPATDADEHTTDDESSLPSFLDNRQHSGYYDDGVGEAKQERRLRMVDMDAPYGDGNDEFRMGLSVVPESELREDSSMNQRSETLRVSEARRRFNKIKNVFAAISAFKEIAPRGHVMYAIRAEGCDLSPYATLMIAHALKDNTYITDLFLGNNHTMLSTSDSCLCIADLMQQNNIRVLDVKNTGIDDRTARSLSQAISKSSRIQSVDVSFNSMTATGATWFTGATGDLFFDHIAISTTPSKTYAVDLL